MPEGRKRLTGATKGLLDSKQDKPRLYPALLGAYVDGVKQIKVGSRQDFVWCRMRGSSSEVVQAMNDSVGLHWDLPILVYRDPLAPGMWKVYGRDVRQYSDWEGASYLPPHADAHSFAGANNTGIDPVWVFKRQYMPMLPRPVAPGTLSIYIEADFWTWGGRYYWWPGSGTTTLAPYLPTGALNGTFVTVYMDGASKIPKFIKGDEFAAWYPPSDPTAFITLPTPSQGVPLAAVFLTTGTEWIGWGEIYDLWQPAEPLFDELATGSVVIRDEGTILGSATVLNFVGPGVVASMSGSYCQVTVPGPGVDQIGMWGWDDGIPVGTGTILNATYGIDLTRSALADQLGKPVGDMYAGAIGPSIAQTLIFMLYILVLSVLRPRWVPPLPVQARTLRGWVLLKRVLWGVVPAMSLIYLVLGTIFLGLATPTEAGAMGAVGALVLGALRGRLTRRLIWQGMDNTMRLSSMVIFILIGATVFSLVFQGVDGPHWVEGLLGGLPGGQVGFLIVVSLFIFVLALSPACRD